MATSKEYFDYIWEHLSPPEEYSSRKMMGEYILYYRGKVVGGVYDNRLLVKPTPASQRLLPDAPYELPYEGAKEMLLVEDIENTEALSALFEAMYPELPAVKKKK